MSRVVERLLPYLLSFSQVGRVFSPIRQSMRGGCWLNWAGSTVGGCRLNWAGWSVGDCSIAVH